MVSNSTIDYQIDSIPKSTKQLLKMAIKPFRFKFVLFLFLSFLAILAWAATPLVIATIINHLTDYKMVDKTIWIFVLIYGLLLLAEDVCWRTAEVTARSFKPQMVESVRTNLFASILKKPYSYFVNSSSGRIGHWINQSTSTTSDIIDTTFWTAWAQFLSLLLSAIFLFTTHWSLALLFIVWLVLIFIFNIKRGKTFSKLVAKQSDETSKASGMVVDAVSNHLSVKVFNAQQRETSLLQKQQQNIIVKWRASWWQNLVTNIVKGQSAVYMGTLALIIVIYLYSQGIVQIGSIVLFITYFGAAASSLWQLAWALDSYYRQFGTIQNALDGLNGVNERTVEKDHSKQLPKTVAIDLTNVSFAYPEQPKTNVLKSINISINSGDKIGVVGHSGAGKSTLVGLLLGFYEPTGGNIYFNNQDILQKDPSYARALSSYVPQDTNLFNRTIKENVMYAKPSATNQEFIAALKQAQAYDFVQNLPKKEQTLVGERGVKLSGGQRQRLAIARAILQDAPILILDEATSALDSVSEQAIQKALHQLMQNRTTIVIAHRLSTLKHLDKIIVIENGTIAEQGNHQTLIDKNGIYSNLWHRQKDGFILD